MSCLTLGVRVRVRVRVRVKVSDRLHSVPIPSVLDLREIVQWEGGSRRPPFSILLGFILVFCCSDPLSLHAGACREGCTYREPFFELFPGRVPGVGAQNAA